MTEQDRCGSDADARPSLYLSHSPEREWLAALEFGRVDDGQPEEWWDSVGSLGYLRPDGSRAVGFCVGLSEFDPDAPKVERAWREPHFDVPLLGLRDAPAAAIVVAAQNHFGDRPSLNRHLFSIAVRETGEAALTAWTLCLESGDAMAHFALGYTHFELGNLEKAYRHLRHYAEIAPAHPWNLCWLGKAATALGNREEARDAYRRAIELEEEGAEETDAEELLRELRGAG